ncbi:MAG: hypothetical protein WC763_03105 [Candidatus Paceibacterota bacterium]|jgi:hypothetical protein
MNKKGIIAAIVVIILVVVGFSILKKGDTVSPTGTSTPVVNSEVPAGVTKADYTPVTKDSTDVTLLGRLKKASVGVSEDGSRVALSNGTGSFSIEGSATKGTVTLGDIAIEKVKGSRNDVLTTVAVNNGGSTTNTYVVLFQDQGSALDDKAYALVGEGVKVTGIRTDVVSDSTIDYIVSVSYTDKAGKAHTKILVVEAGLFNASKEISL